MKRGKIMLSNKKAVSGVVVTVLLVLIAIIAVGVLWMAVKPLIEGGETAAKLQDCLTLRLSIEQATYNAGTGTLTVKVKRGTGKADLSRIKFLVGTDEDSSEGMPEGSSNWPDELETKTYTITGIVAKPEKIEIAGVLSGDKGEHSCDIADTIEADEIQ